MILACYKVKGSGKDKQEKLKNVSQRPTGEEAAPVAVSEDERITSADNAQKVFADMNAESASELVPYLLKKLNCTYQEYDDEPYRIFLFECQGGHFKIFANLETMAYRLVYPCCLGVDVEEEGRLMVLCQLLTFTYHTHKATTCYIEERNECNVNLYQDKTFCGDPKQDFDQFMDGMAQCFTIQRDAQQMLEDARKKPMPQFGSVLAHEERRMMGLTRRYMMERSAELKLKDTAQSPFLLINLLGMLKATWLIDEPKSLTVVTSDSETLTDTTAIRNWQLLKPLLEQEGLKCVTYVVGYGEERVCLTLTRLEEDEKTACFLIECRAKGVDFEECIWHDKRSEAARLAEFSYMADEEGKGDVQTAGQEDNDGKGEQPWDCHLYWGKKAFLEERFLNAIDELEKAFEMMKSALAGMTEEQKETFSDVIWMLGHSYLELGLYKTAFYYLSTFQEEGHLNQRRDFINTLVAARDHRAYDIVSEEMSLAERYIRQNCKDEDCSGVFEYLHLTVFRSFVKVCTDQRLLTEAETILNMLSTDESNQDFVEEYTERIRQLREAEKRNEKETE